MLLRLLEPVVDPERVRSLGASLGELLAPSLSKKPCLVRVLSRLLFVA